jgi:hypothetical protein
MNANRKRTAAKNPIPKEKTRRFPAAAHSFNANAPAVKIANTGVSLLNVPGRKKPLRRAAGLDA